ncbi:site-specific integrase [Streptomyces sp. NBC_00452]|uniref:tyrosine-type recombinase/integrase n=1 Tax=Streptomyces sp. NBC_00452 TaxID=2975746 RepID=UPI00224FD0AD|nr:site-specific integrase [Streptomyces sp. NBC_00452]MCX5063884.1 site-specific integrase [Streptomyces sp. NBC_00452]
MGSAVVLEEKWPVLGRHERAAEWLRVWTDLGRAPRTIDAYALGLAEYLLICERDDVDPVTAGRLHVAAFVKDLSTRPSRRGANVVVLDSGAGLANATLQQRLVPVRLFYDYLIEEGLRESNPVGRGRYTPGRKFGSHERGLVPHLVKLPWIPSEQQWLDLLDVVREEPVQNRVMLALPTTPLCAREELCSLRTEDVDPAHWTLRIRAETTKTRRERVVPPKVGAQPHRQCRRHHQNERRTPLGQEELQPLHSQHPAPVTGSAPARQVIVSFRSRGAGRSDTHVAVPG